MVFRNTEVALYCDKSTCDRRSSGSCLRCQRPLCDGHAPKKNDERCASCEADYSTRVRALTKLPVRRWVAIGLALFIAGSLIYGYYLYLNTLDSPGFSPPLAYLLTFAIPFGILFSYKLLFGCAKRWVTLRHETTRNRLRNEFLAERPSETLQRNGIQ